MDHDFDAQRAETLQVWRDLSATSSLREIAKLDLHFVPASSGADWNGFEARLAAAGYNSERYEDGRTLEASIGPVDFSVDAIWEHELATTKIALDCGFKPDGWGFFADTRH